MATDKQKALVDEVLAQDNELKGLRVLASALVSRSNIAKRLGMSYGGDRDLYQALGYSKTLQFDDFWARYERQDIAARIVDAPVNASWRKVPEVNENDEDETQFEKAWTALTKDSMVKVYHYIRRADKLAGVCQYGVLFLGFDDGKEPHEPVESAKSLKFLRAYTEQSASITQYDRDSTSERFGMPTMYSINTANLADEGVNQGKALTVHWTRIIHIADGLLENEVYGTPRLKKVFNRLQDLELVSGSSAEMFWRGAFPGLGFMADADADIDTTALADMESEIEEYVHGLKRYLRMQGITIAELAQQVADPTGHVDILLKLISGATGIPVRILTGSEAGELASSQDESNWNTRVEERRDDYCELIILRPLIDRLIEFKVLPEPGQDGYTIDWPDLFSPSEKEQVEVAKSRSEILAAYVNAQGADMVMPIEMFLEKLMGFTPEEVQMALDMIQTAMDEEADEIEEAEAQAALEAEAAAAAAAEAQRQFGDAEDLEDEEAA